MASFHSRDAVTSRLRLRGYDYSTPGTYYITICTERRLHLFGDIRDGQCRLSPAGVVIESWWHSIPNEFGDVLLDEMIVMPNHLHGLLSLGAIPDAAGVITPHDLSKVIGWFKSKTTQDYILGVRTEGWPPFPGKLWQERFHDHIVRSDRSFERIRAYIEANPSQWSQEKYYSG